MKQEIGSADGLRYFHSTRTQTGIYRRHSVLWDLGPHDVSMIKYLSGQPNDAIEDIFAVGHCNYCEGQPHANRADTVFFRLCYSGGFRASAFLSWCHPKRARDIVVASDDRFILFEENSRLSVYEHNMPLALAGDNPSGHRWKWERLIAEKTDRSDPLRIALNCFVSCVAEEAMPPPESSAQFACEVVELLERIEGSMQ
jgi:predicted dehydrogenase